MKKCSMPLAERYTPVKKKLVVWWSHEFVKLWVKQKYVSFLNLILCRLEYTHYHSAGKRDRCCCWRLAGAVIQNIHKLSKMWNLDVNFFKVKLQTSNFANVSEVDQTVGIPAYKKNIYQEGCSRGCPFLDRFTWNIDR